ncbi:MAG: tetratricopeptide repeat protein [Bacteroidaceae bacterium]|nr:tetratricopeptide repeat protein [Bacteroidaceae bacterium]
MKKHIQLLAIIALAILVSSCASRKKNTAVTRMYHAFSARYNTFYNGNVAFKDGNLAQIKGHKDNYLELLPMLINSNKNTNAIGVANYDRAIEKSQKAIKNHSIKRKPKKPRGKKLSDKQKRFYEQNEFNPFLWRPWLMMAESQFKKGEFTEAASTYIYIAHLYENNPKIVAKARIGLANCYTEMEWFYESEDLLTRIKRDSLPSKYEKEYAQAKANLLIKQKRYSEALPNIKKAIKRRGATNTDKAREYYLMGQLYKKTGDNKAAFKSFKKVIAKNPPYELEFNARIRQTESRTNESKKGLLRKLNRMARSSKNKNYLSQIYYAIGNIHISDKDTTEALKAYEEGVKKGEKSGYGTGMLHLSLAKIYWEKEKFSKSKENYDKAQQMLGTETPEKDEIKFRCKVLQELVAHTDIIEKQSELLYWATLSDAELYPIIDKLIKEAKEREKEEKKAEKLEKRKQAAGGDLTDASTAAEMSVSDPTQAGKWYFYNPSLVSKGIRSFARKWENRELKDFWRLKAGVILANEDDEEESSDSIANDSTLTGDSILAGDSIKGGEEDIAISDSASTDPTTREYYLSQIPRTEEEKQKAHDALRDALFEAGIIFKDKAGDKKQTFAHLEKVTDNYPEFERMPEAYYHLFLAASRWDESEKAELYRNKLLAEFPENELALRIQQPDFFETAATRKHNEDSIYVKAYNHYKSMEYYAVEKENEVAGKRYPKGNHRARFLFIDAMSKLYGGKQDEALASLKKLVDEYGNDSISRIGKDITTGIQEGRLLRSGISVSIWDRKSDGTIKGESDSLPTFSKERNEPYYFIFAFPKESLDEKRLLFEVARYNFSHYMVRNFTLEFKELAQITMFQIKEFLNFDEAFVYRKRLYGNSEMATLLEGINAYIISKSNLDLLLEHYSFADYHKFYEENLLNIPELEIDGYTLDEPDYGDEEEAETDDNNLENE